MSVHSNNGASAPIANCPVCGNPQVEMLNEHAMPSGAYCCGVRCDSLELWNRYAAAREFVEWVSRQHYANGLSKAMIIQKANEVFK